MVATVQSASAGTIRQPSGYFVMQPLHGNRSPLSNSVVGSPKLVGVHLRDKWSLVEPSQGNNSFTWFDEQIARAKQLGKQVTLGIYAGTNSPSWLAAPQVSGVPLPWSSTVVSAFNAMIGRLGAHFQNEPVIAAVHMSSPATNHSMEMYYPDGLRSVAGYSDAKVIGVWESAIDAYSLAFPNNALVLDEAMVPDSRGYVTKTVANYARQVLGERLNVITCNLKASTNIQAPHMRELAALHAAGVRIGFEMVGPSIDRNRFGGSFAEALVIGRNAGAAWYQIYQQDIPNLPTYRIARLSAVTEPQTTTVLGIALTISGFIRRRR